MPPEPVEPADDNVPAEFDAFAGTYEADVCDATAFARQDPAFYLELKAAALAGLLAATFGTSSNARVLDVGCGSGTLDRFLMPHIAELHGVDVAAEMIARATLANPVGTYTWYDGGRLPYEDATFDLAFSSCVLHHVPVPERTGLVGELARVVRPGGLVVILEHNPFNPLTRIVVSRCRFDADAVLLRQSESTSLLRTAGLVDAKCDYVLFFPWSQAAFRRVERVLRRIPLGAQYVASARRTVPPSTTGHP